MLVRLIFLHYFFLAGFFLKKKPAKKKLLGLSNPFFVKECTVFSKRILHKEDYLPVGYF